MIPLTEDAGYFVVSIEELTSMLFETQMEIMDAFNKSLETGNKFSVPSIEIYLKNKIIDSLLKYSGQGN